jgi:hypothetical protein
MKNSFGRSSPYMGSNHNDFDFPVTKNSTSQASVEPGKMSTSTSEVVKKFFKLDMARRSLNAGQRSICELQGDGAKEFSSSPSISEI